MTARNLTTEEWSLQAQTHVDHVPPANFASPLGEVESLLRSLQWTSEVV